MTKLQNDVKLRRLVMSYAHDGILDIYIGLIALLAGLALFADMVWMAGAYVAIFVPLLWSSKEKITLPRLRREDVDPAAAGKSGRLLFLLAGGLALLAVLGLVVFLLFEAGDLAQETKTAILVVVAGLVGVAILGGFLYLGRAHRAPQWYAYAGIILLLALLGWALQIALPWIVVAAGALMFVTGSVYLARFLRSHPILPETERPAW